MAVHLVMRNVVGAIGAGLIGIAVFGWGKRDQGPQIEPQWLVRLMAASIGSVMLYVAVVKY